ncbi:copper chaperone PCu(A)C [Microvirgula aerodenitrificans]|uniref:copper chaperone PCu(A)C n=1 Tax=Microvirgula aerodenitrificans TaxID=57480 RepID=UPI0009FDF3A2|nr:copper chaperone PCu(A)C [Microvirgula aerodenitrificans]
MQRLLLCLSVTLTMLCMPALADPGTVTARDGWAWRTRAGQYGSAGFVTLTSTTPARLIAASSPRVGRVEIHESFVDAQGRFGMRRLGALPLSPARPLVMRHDGIHLMLIGLRTPLAVGDRLPLTLTIDSGGLREIVSTTLVVKAL